MNCYETLFVVKPTLTEEEIKGQIARVEEIIAEEGGELKARDEMGMRRLAYPIEKQERGYYTVVYYTAPATLVGELERQLRYNEEILRFMTVKYTNKKEIAQFEKMIEAAKGKGAAPAEQPAESAEEAPAQAGSAPAEAEAAQEESQTAESAEA
ncbi:30S ribosomal protein S6 [Nitratifractor sp.]